MSGTGTGQNDVDLEELIMERKEEKRKVLKEKLRTKLKTIRDRRGSVYNEPFPDGAFERLKSCKVWQKVLGYLTDPSDVSSSYFACGTFSRILEERRKLMMLPKVLNVFKISGCKDGDYDASSMSWKNWKAICLNVRTVSQAWKKIADFQLFDSEFSKKGWFLKTDISVDSNACVFEDEKNVDRAMSILSSSSGIRQNSSLIRNVHVKVDLLKAPEPLYGKVIEFLKIYGSSVWFFHFDWTFARNIAAVYESLCEMLKLMPNLKGLDLKDINLAGGRPEGEIHEFRSDLDQHSFPVLDSLVHIRCVSTMDEYLLSQILKKCVNLKSVIYPESRSISEKTIEALKKLTLERYVGDLKPLVTITPLPLPNPTSWPLKHLTITSNGNVKPSNLKASVLFPALKRYQGTLQYLHLGPHTIVDVKSVRLYLPNLKIIHLHGISSHASLGFDDLLPLKSLEKIIVNFVKHEDDDAEVKVKPYLHSKKMEESNLWECLPNLRSLKVNSGTIFYRPCLAFK